MESARRAGGNLDLAVTRLGCGSRQSVPAPPFSYATPRPPCPNVTAQAQGPPSGVHFHHVHLNVTDPKATIAFYHKFFGANEVSYRGLSDGRFTEKGNARYEKLVAGG